MKTEHSKRPGAMIHLLNYGMGVESTAILLRWILEPHTRPFESFEELIVLTAQTGDEMPETGTLVERYIMPLMRKHGIRYVQVAKAGPSVKDGYTVLGDSNSPNVCYIEGDYSLFSHLEESGTVPRLGRPHLCAIKWKGNVLDKWIQDNISKAFGPYIGYNADETKRADKSSDYGCRGESYIYPLIEWGWNRQACIDFLKKVFGVTWQKSACRACPFRTYQNATETYLRDPEAGARTLWSAGLALALNPRMHLFGSGTALEVMQKGGCTEAIKLYNSRLSKSEFSVYNLRRIYTNVGKTKRTVINARRSVKSVFSGNRNESESYLSSIAKESGSELVFESEWLRSYKYRRKEKVYPTLEEFWVTAPSGVKDKCVSPAKFNQLWQSILNPVEQLSLM